MQLLLDTPGLTVRKRNNRFWITDGENTRTISPIRVSSIAVTADCLLSSAAVRLAVEHNIPVFITDRYGDVSALLWSAAFTGLPELRRKQAFFDGHDDAAAWLVELFLLKTAHQHDNIAWLNSCCHAPEPLANALAALDEAIPALRTAGTLPLAEAKTALLIAEAQMAKAYWPALAACLPPAWSFEKRSRRPALDPFNALLNYGYGMLYRVVELAAFSAGLDPYMGLLHAEEYQQPALVFDLIEPFRPWVDRLVLEQFFASQIQENHFLRKVDGVLLARPGKAHWIPAFELWLKEKLTVHDWGEYTRRTHIHRYAGALATHLRNWNPGTPFPSKL